MRQIVFLVLTSLLFGLSTSAVYANGDSTSSVASVTLPHASSQYLVEPNPTLTKRPAKKKAKPRRPRMTYYQPPSATLYPGSLKHNIVRIANAFGWNTVIWNVPNDYNWVGTTTITASSFSGILRK